MRNSYIVSKVLLVISFTVCLLLLLQLAEERKLSASRNLPAFPISFTTTIHTDAFTLDQQDRTVQNTTTYDTTTAFSNSPTWGLIVVKLPRSGSTWFTEILNELGGVYVSKEIMQHSDRLNILSSNDSVSIQQHISKLENHLHRALKYPTGKYQYTNRYVPWLWDSRYMTDYLFHPSLKALRPLLYTGFTLNLEHTKGLVNWANVLNPIFPLNGANLNANIKVILYLRANIVKTAVSAYRGKMSLVQCGQSNAKRHSSCRPPSRVNWTIDEFQHEVNHWIIRRDKFLTLFHENKYLSSLVTSVVYYEDMQTNPHSTLKVNAVQ